MRKLHSIYQENRRSNQYFHKINKKCSLETDLLGRRFPPCAVKRVQFLEGGLGPDTEAPDVTTRGYLQQIKMGNVNERDARYVTEGASDAVVLVIDDERSTPLDAATIPHLTLAGTEPTRVFHLQTNHRYGNISTVSRFTSVRGTTNHLISF